MQNYTRSERAQYNLDRDRKCERLGITKQQYNWFRRMSEKYRSYYEKDCNVGLTWGDESTIAQMDYKLEAKCQEFGLHFYLQSDPRGCALYLDIEPISHASYTNACAIY